MFGLPFGEKLLLQSRGGVFIRFAEALDDIYLPVAWMCPYELAAEIASIAPITCLRLPGSRCR
jgi:hypothetical protein